MLQLRQAKTEERGRVAALYRAAIGTPGCTWNEYYPGDVELDSDLQSGGLWVLCEGEDILGAVSVVAENELDEACNWTVADSAREIARVVVDRRYLGQGLATQMLRELFEHMKSEGCRAIHLSVACGNAAAKRCYEKLGFAFLGQCDMYGSRYELCEKLL